MEEDEQHEIGRVTEHMQQAQLFECEKEPETLETAGSPNILNISTKQPLEQRFSYPGCSSNPPEQEEEQNLVEFGNVVAKGEHKGMSESEVSEIKARSTLNIKSLNQDL